MISDLIDKGGASPHIPTLPLNGPVTEESTYAVATLLMSIAHRIMDFLHLSKSDSTFIIIYAIVVFIVAFSIGWLTKYILVAILRHIHFKKESSLYNILVKRHFFTTTCNIIPPLVFLIFIQFTLNSHVSIAAILTRLSWACVLLVIAISLCTLADCIWEHLDAHDNKRKLPLRGIVQVLKLIIWIVCVIVITGLIINKSPATLLAGLGAFAALLMLIFKDSILGLVAGVQLAQNDSLHVGDWISVPGTKANGTVSEVSLTAVKIINWDLTVTTVAPYSLITNGFTNYRNMQESNTRRICRSYYIDADSVVPATPEMYEEFSKIPYMADWIKTKTEQRDRGIVENVNNRAGLADGTIDTNLGMFRAYLTMYLNDNPDISHEPHRTCCVTSLEQTSAGIPLQIYCFTATSSWLSYAGIQASIFEHIAVMLYRFHLYVFEYPSGRDILADGSLSPEKTVKAPKKSHSQPFAEL